MVKNKFLFFIAIYFLITSCNSWDSVKRGLTGKKLNQTDEFLVKKKDPLTLPPDFENLPSPSQEVVLEESSSASLIEKKLKKISEDEGVSSSSSSSTEKSILEQIRSQ